MQSQQVIDTALTYYAEIAALEDYSFIRWVDTPKPFATVSDASRFLFGCLVDQGQDSNRAEEAENHFIEHHFSGERIWFDILATSPAKLYSICTTGFKDGTSYALRYASGKLAGWLRANATIFVEQYSGDPRNLWNDITSDTLSTLWHRIYALSGFGVALSNMTVNLLVRQRGIAGGKQARSKLKLKPDLHVKRILYRLGEIEEPTVRAVNVWAEMTPMSSPADVDAALWVASQQYCHANKPNCNECCFSAFCDKRIESH